MMILGKKTRLATEAEKVKERSVTYSLIADLVIVFLIILFALVTGSLTMLSEAIRSSFMTLVEIYSLWLMIGAHRGRMGHFQFGIGKVERFAWLMFGAALTISGFWVVRQVVANLFEDQVAPTPLGLAYVAVINAINLVINFLSFCALLAASGQGESEIFRAQIRARILKLINSVLLQIALTIAALSTDQLIVLILDGVGAIFIACVMVVSGISMVIKSLPDLLDAPLSRPITEKISEIVSGTPTALHDIRNIRTRRSGRFPQVEITISHLHSASLTSLDERIKELHKVISELDDQIDLTVRVMHG